QRVLCRDRVPLREVTVSGHHAAEVLGPGPILGGVNDDMPDVLQAQLLGLLREAEKAVGLARNEQVHGVAHALASDPRHLVLRVDAHVRQHARYQDLVPTPTYWMATV